MKKGFTMTTMSPKEKRAEIQMRIDDGGFSINQVVMESKYTNLPKYLQGADIQSEKLYDVEQALDRMAEAKVKAVEDAVSE